MGNTGSLFLTYPTLCWRSEIMLRGSYASYQPRSKLNLHATEKPVSGIFQATENTGSHFCDDPCIKRLPKMFFSAWQVDKIASTVPLDKPMAAPNADVLDGMTLDTIIRQTTWTQGMPCIALLKGTISSWSEQTFNRAWNRCPSLRWTRWLEITGSFMQQQR